MQKHHDATSKTIEKAVTFQNGSCFHDEKRVLFFLGKYLRNKFFVTIVFDTETLLKYLLGFVLQSGVSVSMLNTKRYFFKLGMTISPFLYLHELSTSFAYGMTYD